MNYQHQINTKLTNPPFALSEAAAEHDAADLAKMNVRAKNVILTKNGLLHRITTFIGDWTEASYRAWEKRGRPMDF